MIFFALFFTRGKSGQVEKTFFLFYKNKQKKVCFWFIKAAKAKTSRSSFHHILLVFGFFLFRVSVTVTVFDFVFSLFFKKKKRKKSKTQKTSLGVTVFYKIKNKSFSFFFISFFFSLKKNTNSNTKKAVHRIGNDGIWTRDLWRDRPIF